MYSSAKLPRNKKNQAIDVDLEHLKKEVALLDREASFKRSAQKPEAVCRELCQVIGNQPDPLIDESNNEYTRPPKTGCCG